MKILFVTWRFPNFDSTFILNEIVELIEQGHDVRILSLFKREAGLQHDDFEQWNLGQRTLYLRSGDRRPRPLRASLSRYLSRPLQPYAKNFESVASEVVDAGIEFIHADFANLGATAAMVISAITGIPFSFEAHARDLFVTFHSQREKCNRCEFILTESEYNRRYLVERLGVDRSKIEVVPICPNVRWIRHLQEGQRQPSSVVSVCRLHRIKGLVHAIEAVRLARHDIPHLKYSIVGDGPQRDELSELIHKYNLEKHVRLVGPLTNRDAMVWVRRSLVFLLPSVIDPSGDRDGTPTAIAEAMHLGTAVISSNICGIPEMVEHGVSGVLHEPKAVTAIAESLIHLLTDEPSRASMVAAAKERAQQQFNPTRSVSRLVNAFCKSRGRGVD